MNPGARAIAVTGDLTVDWVLVAPPEPADLQLAYLWERQANLSLTPMPGGAALIARLLRESGCEVLAPELPAGALSDPRCDAVTRTFANWAPVPAVQNSRETRLRFREFLGQARATGSTVANAAAAPVLVIDDANLGFGDSADAARFQAGAAPETVVVRLSPPLAREPLWSSLSAVTRRLVVYVSLGDLRKENAPIGQALSWERTAAEVVRAVGQVPALQAATHVVVGIGLSGAVVVEKGGEATLVYDPGRLEGDWESEHPGIPYGVGAVVTATVAEACAAGAISDVAGTVARGLARARRMHEVGMLFGEDGAPSLPMPGEVDAAAFSTAPISLAPDWSLLGDRGDLRAIAKKVLVDGLEGAAPGVPVDRMGAWVSVDRAEIEALRSVRNIIGEYVGLGAAPRPVSVAVFGPPGAGKSFAIKQLASMWAADGRRIEVLEFNLSQFEDMDALCAAFQRVRDCAVNGALPLVFWDEFDSAREGRELGWLAPFLAPMQDGTFLERSLVRPIGRAVFVFAGGTHATMESFKSRATDLPGAKATDFLSRLRGYIDILGPNPSVPNDNSFVVRRALLLRQMLQRRAPQLFDAGHVRIDPGIANSFLSVGRYVHGSRSMEAIVEMSSLSGRARFTRSALPAAHQLELHVGADEFLGLLETNPEG